MKLDLETGTTLTGNVDTTRQAEMLVSAEAMPHIAQLLTNLYNDPELAVFREYVANGIDAHHAMGSTDPVEVWIPTRETPMFKVIDHGIGMSESDILTIASQYGLSTKSTENGSIGGFGLGFKSALALASQFTVTSVKDGIKTTAIIHNSEDGISRTNVVDSRVVEDPNGTTVAIPVPDWASFAGKAHKFMKYFPAGTIKINGHTLNENYKDIKKDEFLVNVDFDIEVEIRNDEYETRNVEVNLYKGHYNNPVTLIMGGVSYTVPSQDVRSVVYNGENSTVISLLTSKEVVIEAPVGAVKLSPSREGVQFNTRTKDFFIKTYKELTDVYVEKLTESVKNSGSYSEAVLKYRDLEWDDQTAIGAIEYKGVKLKDHVYLSDKGIQISYGRQNNSYSDFTDMRIDSPEQKFHDRAIFTGDVSITTAKRMLGDYLKLRARDGDPLRKVYFVPEGVEFNHAGVEITKTKQDDGTYKRETKFTKFTDEEYDVVFDGMKLEITDLEDIKEEVRAYRRKVREENKGDTKSSGKVKRDETKYVTFTDDGEYTLRTSEEVASYGAYCVVQTKVRKSDTTQTPFQSVLDVAYQDSGELTDKFTADILKETYGDNFMLVCLTGSKTIKSIEKELGDTVGEMDFAECVENSVKFVEGVTEEELATASIMRDREFILRLKERFDDPVFDRYTEETQDKVTKAVAVYRYLSYQGRNTLGNCAIKDNYGYMSTYEPVRKSLERILEERYPLVMRFRAVNEGFEDDAVLYVNSKYAVLCESD